MADGGDPISGADEGSRTEGVEDSASKPTLGDKKVKLFLKATGDAPILTKSTYTLDRFKQVAYVLGFLHKALKCNSEESIFLYVNQSFSPAPDVDIGTLYDCFGADGKLVLHYCKTQAWG